MIYADVPMPEECRRCHYPLEDLLNSDLMACLDQQTAGDPARRCFSLDHGWCARARLAVRMARRRSVTLCAPWRRYNFKQDFYGIIADGAVIDLTIAGETDLSSEEEDGVGDGAAGGGDAGGDGAAADAGGDARAL